MNSDTNPEINEIYEKMMLEKTSLERFKMGFSMLHSARIMALSTIKNKENLKVELFLRFYSGDFDETTKGKIIASIRNYKRI